MSQLDALHGAWQQHHENDNNKMCHILLRGTRRSSNDVQNLKMGSKTYRNSLFQREPTSLVDQMACKHGRLVPLRLISGWLLKVDRSWLIHQNVQPKVEISQPTNGGSPGLTMDLSLDSSKGTAIVTN
jgi:hypothetical protein